jgi:cytosine/uracil/thiamine/allantoin permease
VEVSPFWRDLYSYAWFVSFGVAFLVYLMGMSVFGASRSASQTPRRGF